MMATFIRIHLFTSVRNAVWPLFTYVELTRVLSAASVQQSEPEHHIVLSLERRRNVRQDLVRFFARERRQAKAFAADELVGGVNLRGEYPSQLFGSVLLSFKSGTHERLMLLGAERNRESGRLEASFAVERDGLPAEDARLLLTLSSHICLDRDDVRSGLDDDDEGKRRKKRKAAR